MTSDKVATLLPLFTAYARGARIQTFSTRGWCLISNPSFDRDPEYYRVHPDDTHLLLEAGSNLTPVFKESVRQQLNSIGQSIITIHELLK